MDLETVVNRIDELENILASLRKSVVSQNARIGDLDEKTNRFLEQTREQKNEISKLSSSVNGIGQFDPALTKVRIDFNKQLEESEKRNQLNIKMLGKVHNDEIKAASQTIDKAMKELSEQIDQKLKLFANEDIRMVQSIKEAEKRIDQKMNSDDSFKFGLANLESEVRQNKKIVDNLVAEVDSYKKRMDEVRAKSETILDEIHTNESRLTEIVATENERKQAFITIMEQQTLMKNEREREWQDWEVQFNEAIGQVYKLIPELQNQSLEMKKTKESFEEVTQKFDRRVNELTEMYRLMDEKFRKEWTAFKSDLEQRWSGVSLLLEDKQEDLSGHLEKINERIQEVEDNTHDMQEVLILMSKEIQKGMQGLMSMVNGWLDAFGQIK